MGETGDDSFAESWQHHSAVHGERNYHRFRGYEGTQWYFFHMQVTAGISDVFAGIIQVICYADGISFKFWVNVGFINSTTWPSRRRAHERGVFDHLISLFDSSSTQE